MHAETMQWEPNVSRMPLAVEKQQLARKKVLKGHSEEFVAEWSRARPKRKFINLWLENL